MELSDLVTIGGLVAIIYTVIMFLRNLVSVGSVPTAKNSVVTQIIVWVSAFVVLLLVAQSDLGPQIVVLGETPLSRLNLASLAVVALALGSSGSVLDRYIKAKDNTQSAAAPHLLNDPPA